MPTIGKPCIVWIVQHIYRFKVCRRLVATGPEMAAAPRNYNNNNDNDDNNSISLFIYVQSRLPMFHISLCLKFYFRSIFFTVDSLHVVNSLPFHSNNNNNSELNSRFRARACQPTEESHVYFFADRG